MGLDDVRRGDSAGLGSARVVLGAPLIALVVACSVLVHEDAAQCTKDADCARFPGTVCDTHGGCAAAPPPPDAGNASDAPIACTTTQDCIALLAPNAFSICRKTDSTCVSLLSEDCGTVLGSYTSDDAVFLGAMMPLVGTDQSTGLSTLSALRLAVDFDFAAGLSPLAPEGNRRPLVVVACDETRNPLRAATHLVADLGVPAIIGATSTETTAQLAEQIAPSAPGGLLLLSPRATGDLSALPSRQLVWRAAPPATLEARAMALVAETMVAPPVPAPARVAVVHKADNASLALDQGFAGAFVLDGQPALAPANAAYFTDTSYGNPDSDPDPSADYAAAIAALTTMDQPPDVVVVIGTTEAAANLIGGIESTWSQGTRPRYLVSSGVFVPELLGVVAADDNLRHRVLVTVPGRDPSAAPFAAFRVDYETTFSDGVSTQAPTVDVYGTANTYDAFYVLALGVAALGTTPVTANALAGALPRVSTPGAASVDVGPGALAGDAGADAAPGDSLFGALADGGAIALRGTSGPLAFDPTTHDVTSDVQVYCVVRPDTTKPPAFFGSGLAFDATSGALTGAISSACAN